MNKTLKIALLATAAPIAMMQAWAGVLLEEHLTEVMLNNADNTDARPVAAYECTTWNLKTGKTIRYELVENGATGCPVPKFWEVL